MKTSNRLTTLQLPALLKQPGRHRPLSTDPATWWAFGGLFLFCACRCHPEVLGFQPLETWPRG